MMFIFAWRVHDVDLCAAFGGSNPGGRACRGRARSSALALEAAHLHTEHFILKYIILSMKSLFLPK